MNQYLRPEYLTPLPTTLDAKKSPLALLAQTCSSIGADPPKSFLTNLDSKQVNSNGSNSNSKTSVKPIDREKSSPSTSNDQVRTSFKPYESCLVSEKNDEEVEHSSSSRSKTPGGNSSSGSSGGGGSSKRCSSNQSATCSTRTTTPSRRSPIEIDEQTSNSSNKSGSHLASNSSQSKKSFLTEPVSKNSPGGITSPANYLANYPHQLPVDLANSFVHHAALKNGLTGSNLYLNYGRLKHGESIGICQDPYCSGCQLNSHLLGINPSSIASSASSTSVPVLSTSTPTSAAMTLTSPSNCPAGCIQCDHKQTMSANLYGSPVGPNPAVAAAAYAHAQLAALAAASQLPYVCNWIASDTVYCGKRFSTSDELLQHLRSHTAASSADPTMGLPAFRTYPLTPPRYHPYGKPSLLPPIHPTSLPPYYSAIYASPRIGTAPGHF